MITADTDVRIFIEHHRSDNPIVQREVFQQYGDTPSQSKKSNKSNSDKTSSR